MEYTVDAVFIADADGVIEFVNPALERLTGLSRQELIGKTPRAFHAEFEDPLPAVLLAGGVYRGEFVDRRRDGSTVHCEETIVPMVDEAGRITKLFAVAHDLGDRSRVEEILRQLNEALEHQSNRIARALHDEAGQFLTAAYTAV